MADTKASEAARQLLAARWGNSAVTRAANVVIERAAELDERQRAQLLAAVGERRDGGDE
jgi:hypothetical protein